MANVGGGVTAGGPGGPGGARGGGTRGGGAGGRRVEVHRVGVTEGRGELGDLLPPDLVHGRGRVAAPDQSCVQRHAPAPSPRDRWGQRVSRWTVCRRSVGQYFFSSIRSG